MALVPRDSDSTDRFRDDEHRIRHQELRRQPAASTTGGAGTAVALDDGTIGDPDLPWLNNYLFTTGHTTTNGWKIAGLGLAAPQIYREGDRVYWRGCIKLQYGSGSTSWNDFYLDEPSYITRPDGPSLVDLGLAPDRSEWFTIFDHGSLCSPQQGGPNPFRVHVSGDGTLTHDLAHYFGPGPPDYSQLLEGPGTTHVLDLGTISYRAMGT